MGCCILRRKCVSIITTKKSTQIRTSKYEKQLDRLHFSKSLANFELQKYYVSEPIPKLKRDYSYSKAYLFSQNNNKLTDNNDKNQKKIKESMRRLKELSSAEVNNCQKYFFKNKKGTNI